MRINQIPLGLEDLDEIVPESPDLILIPKVESPEQMVEADARIAEIKAELRHNASHLADAHSGVGSGNRKRLCHREGQPKNRRA